MVAILTMAGCATSRIVAKTPPPIDSIENIRFTGTSVADPYRRTEALLHIVDNARDRYDCASIEAVEAGPAPAGYVSSLPQPETTVASLSERWVVTQCGEQVPFIITFYILEQGGPIYAMHEERFGL